MGIHGLLSLISSASRDVERYYLALSALTPKENISQSSVAGPSGLAQMDTAAVFASFGPVVIFFAIFISVFGVFFIGRIRNWRTGIMALLLAMTLASSSYILTGVRNGLGGSANAGPDEIPRNVRIVPLSQTTTQIVWDTDAKKIGAVRISPIPYSIKNARVIIGSSGDKTMSHAVTIDNLVSGKTYECEVLSGSRWYDNEGKPLVFRMVL